LACIPPEVEACADLRTNEVTEGLNPFLEHALDSIRIALLEETTRIPALEALKHWTTICHVSLSHLSTPTCGGNESLLPLLIRLLSSEGIPDNTTNINSTTIYSNTSANNTRAQIFISASQALTEAILVPNEYCTSDRQIASTNLLHSIGTHGFVAAPLAYATQQGDDGNWEDACHALATLVCTLVTEEIDIFCTQPAEACLNVLLQIQAHPITKVSLTALECWLAVQDIPVASRHPNWKEPLFTKIAEGIVARIAYPTSFISWQDEFDFDESDFYELRRMVGDVFISAYFLLRVQFVQSMASYITSSSNWTIVEAALFGISSVSREVCARIKARAGGSSVSSDRDSTAQQLLQLVEHLCAAPVASSAEAAARKHPLVLSGVCTFVGSYAPTWNVKCPPEALLQLLAYLREATKNMPSAVVDAAKATKSILTQCSTRLLASEQQQLLGTLRETLDAVLATENEEAMATVAEGLTRLLVQLKEASIVRESLASLVGPLLHRAEATLNAIPVGPDAGQPTEEAHVAVESLARYLHVLQVIIQFCETGAPIDEVVSSIWPILEKTAQCVVQYEFLLDPLLSVHEQMLRNAFQCIEPYFKQTIQFVIQVFEAYKHPSSLAYVSGAVETFGHSNLDDFRNLLDHVSMILFTYVSTESQPHEYPDLIRSYFEMCKRYVLYCPSGLVGCQQFANIVSMAVDCLTSCHGERQSTRATLNFLTQLFGWRLLRLDPNVATALESSSAVVDEQLAKHGSVVTRACVAGLLGGPTMLWPAYSECIFAIANVVITLQTNNANGSGALENNTMVHQWLFEAQQESTLSVETYSQVVMTLEGLSRDAKCKAKAKMLLSDFAKIHRGEMTTDALLSYML